VTAGVTAGDRLGALHVPGDPLVLVNVWDAASARAVAGTPGVRAVATASHAVSEMLGVADGEGMTVDQALAAAQVVIDAVDLPVSVDFERGYGATPDAVAGNIRRLAATGAAGFNLEDSISDTGMRDSAEQVERIRAAHAAAPGLWINARVDSLRRGESAERMLERANAYLDAGAGSVFVLGLDTPELVGRAVAGIAGPVAVIARHGGIPLTQLADLGVARISFGPGPHRLAMTWLARTAQSLTARGDYPPELRF
jgi:2-methylisocitrate lyase-like PEP mutase family enzyme